MDYQLKPQLENAHEIKNILKKIPITFKLADGREVITLLVYLPMKGGISSHSEFFEKIKSGILYNFVFSCSEVENKLGIKSQDSATELFEKALRKLSQHTAKGELGELILFTLLDVYFDAPKILSKVSLKTNPRMPVFGADAVHGRFHNGQFKLYLGESKLHKQFKPAASAAAISIKNAKAKYEDEFDLLDSYIDFPNINDALEAKLLKLLNPFSKHDLANILHSPCFIGFSEPSMIAGSKSKGDFEEKYIELAKAYVEDFFSKIEKQGMSINETALLMLPFSSVDDLVDEFVAHIGIKT